MAEDYGPLHNIRGPGAPIRGAPPDARKRLSVFDANVDEYPELTAAKQAREREALQRARMIVQGESYRLAPLFESAGVEQQTPEQIMHGHAPGYGPELEAQRLERLAGSYELVPGWWDAKQFAEASASRARKAADRVLAGRSRKGLPYNRPLHRSEYDEEFRKNRHLLSGPQFEYLQEVGRTIDLLRNLRDESWSSGMRGPAQVAVEYWDKSNPVHNPGAIRAREDYNDPNYQRFAGVSKGLQSFFQNPDSPLMRWIHVSQVMPSAIGFAHETASGPAGEAFQRAANTRAARLGYMLNDENPVLQSRPPSDPYDYETWGKELAGAGEHYQNVQPPPWQNVANSLWRSVQDTAQRAAGIERPVVSDATAAFGDLLGIFGEAADPSAVAGVLAGVPLRARLLADLARQQGRRPASIVSRAAQATGGQAYQEAVPEVAFSGALNAAGGNPSRTLLQYLTAPQPSTPLDTEARALAHAREETRNLPKGDDSLGAHFGQPQKQSIPDERRKAYYRHLPGSSLQQGLW